MTAGASTITRSSIPARMREGIDFFVGLTYRTTPTEWSSVFETRTTDKPYVEAVQNYGFGVARLNNEGTAITMDTAGESYNQIARIKKVGLGFGITQEAVDDNQYGSTIQQYAPSFARAFITAQEIEAMIYFNNPTDATNYPLGDTKSLLATDHPIYSGTIANTPSTQTDFSEAALEDALTALTYFTDDRGNPIVVRAPKLFIAAGKDFDAVRVLNADKQAYTQSNNPNAVRVLGLVPEIITSHYLTNVKSWFLLTDIPGRYFYRRMALQKTTLFHEVTGSWLTLARERYVFFIMDAARTIYGSVGA